MPMSAKQKKEMTIEEGFSFLEESAKKLGEDEISLEESFAVYEKAMQVLKDTYKKIETVEKKVMVINENGSEEEFQ